MDYKTILLSILSMMCARLVVAQNDYIGQPKIYYGASYYPEAWNSKEIDNDIVNMKKVHINVVRMAEFAWSSVEPAEGRYDFKWLHTCLEKLNNAGIDIILGTPTATPPAWMWEKYPSIGLTTPEGDRPTHGIRRECSYSDSVYRRKSQVICEQYAKEFGAKPGVIGWQTDNEFSLTYDYSIQTKQLWRQYLKFRYGDLVTLNQAWVTALWSQTYQSFEQVPMPAMEKWYHPALKMAWMDFTNEQVKSFQKIQIDAIRKYSTLPITHDSMPGQKIDYATFFKDLDYPAVNNYHSFEAYDLITSNYERMRGYSKRKSWLFETAPNFSGGGNSGSTWYLHSYANSMRAALWLNYTMGAQGAMFWLWRQQPAGQEMTHGAIMHSWNQPSANFDDIAGLGAELEKDSEWLSKLTVKKADVGILYDINNSNFLSIENSANEISYYKDWTYRFYLPLMKSGYQRDVINLTTPINSYKLLFIPLAPYLPSAYIAKLIDWVKKGNTLIVGPMTGYRTEEWAGQSQFGLGLLEKLCGFTTGARIPIGTQPRPAEELIRLTYTDTSLASPATARLWAENYVNLTPLATYTNSILKDKIAIGSKKVGNGRVILLGTDPGTRTIERIIVGEARKLNLVPNCLPQSGIAHCMHTGSNGNGYLLAVNLSVEPRSIVLSKLWTNLDSKASQTGNLILKPFEVVKLVQK